MTESGITLDTITTHAVYPALYALAAEARQPIDAVITLIDADAMASATKSIGGGGDGSVARGEVRVVIKRSDRDQVVFEAQAIIHGLAPGTGLSGLALRGKVTNRAGVPEVKLTGKSIRYNVWTWEPQYELV